MVSWGRSLDLLRSGGELFARPEVFCSCDQYGPGSAGSQPHVRGVSCQPRDVFHSRSSALVLRWRERERGVLRGKGRRLLLGGGWRRYSPSGLRWICHPSSCTRWWHRLHRRQRLSMSVGPSAAQGTTWCAWHQAGSAPHPTHPRSRAIRAIRCAGVASRFPRPTQRAVPGY